MLKTSITLLLLFLAINWCYHIVRKPSEIVGLFEKPFFKNPRETWEAHKSSFKKYSTSIMAPEVLAALAQTESQGNSLARTFWRWKLTSDLFQIYAPASSATGLLQITDGTYQEAKKLCVSDGQVYQGSRCFFNFMYNRLIPSHAIEMTSAYLHKNVVQLQRRYSKPISNNQKQELAIIMHLCGVGAAESYAANGFHFSESKRCGSHSANRYLRSVKRLSQYFAQMD